MTIKIRAFGYAGDVIGSRSFDLDMNEGATTQHVRQHLEFSYPALKDLLQMSIAVNQSYITEDVQLKHGDEVAIIPPVSGG
jgi:molybdopterin converting factor subunit 1